MVTKKGEEVKVNPVINISLVTDLHTKAIDTHQYLLQTSNHPPHVHRNLPFSLGLCLRVIVSEEETLEARLGELKGYLKRRGYNNRTIDIQFDKVRALPREVALQLRVQPRSGAKRTPLVATWDQHWPDFRTLLEQAFPILASSDRLRHIFSLPLVSYQRPANLRNLLVHTRPANATAPSIGPICTYPC